MKLLAFLKDWTLLIALAVGTIIYLLFSEITFLQPIGNFVGPKLVSLMPVLIFVLLYFTFCKIDMHNFKPRKWHFALQAVRTTLSALIVLVIVNLTSPDVKIVWEGIFVIVICPTAAAAAVVTEKLGGSIATMTVYTIIANCFTIIIIPLFFPMVERAANVSFIMAFLMVLDKVSTHPMFGPTFANLNQLSEENAIIINEGDYMGRIFFKDLYQRLGLHIYEYSFDEHDRTVAYSLSIPFVSTFVFAAVMKHQDAPGTTFKRHMKIAHGVLSEDDYLLQEILFNPYTHDQVSQIRSELKELLQIIDDKDSEKMKAYLTKIRSHVANE